MKQSFLLIKITVCFIINVNAQNVGIGTVIPNYPLHIINPDTVGTALNLHTRVFGNVGQLTLLRFTNSINNDNTGFFSSIIGGGRGSSGGSYLIFGTNPTGSAPVEKMRLSELGNLGIGTSNPLTLLDVHAGNPNTTIGNFSTTGGYAQIQVSNGPDTAQVGIEGLLGMYMGTPDNKGVYFKTNGVGRLFIKNESGNVGVGQSFPLNKLDVEGAVAIGASFSGNQTAPADGLLVQGNTGIGTANPTVQLQVNGAIASTSSEITVTGGPQTVNPGNKSYIRITNTSATNAVITLGDGLADGQLLYVLANTTGGGGIQFFDNILNNTQLSSGYLMGIDDTLTLIWNTTLSKWIELHRSVN